MDRCRQIPVAERRELIPRNPTELRNRFLQSGLARGASWIMLGQGASFLLQVAYFVLLARVLGVTEYGIFSGAVALVNVMTPYSTLGTGLLFLRYVTVDHSLAGLYWGNAIAVTCAMSLLLAGLLFAFGPLITHQPNRLLFLALALANCLFSQITAIAGQAFQALGKLAQTATLSFLTNLSRCTTLAFIAFSAHRANALQWSVAVMAASVFAAIVALIWVRAEIGPMSFSARLTIRRAAEGVGFSFAGSTQSTYNDIDKTMLSSYGLNRENGFYTLAYRIIEFASTPIVAMDTALLPRHFVLGQRGIRPTIRLLIKSLKVAICVGASTAVLITLLAPLLPRLVGRDFSGVLIALKWLCWIPLLRGIHRLIGIALTGSGNQNTRTLAQFVVAAANVGLNMWWIPEYGWIAAAWSSLASDGLLCVLNALAACWLVWRSSVHQETLATAGRSSDE